MRRGACRSGSAEANTQRETARSRTAGISCTLSGPYLRDRVVRRMSCESTQGSSPYARQFGGDDELALSANLHAQHALVDAFDEWSARRACPPRQHDASSSASADVDTDTCLL